MSFYPARIPPIENRPEATGYTENTMSPQMRNAETYYEAQDRYHAEMLVKSLGLDGAIRKCCEEQWPAILRQVEICNGLAKAG